MRKTTLFVTLLLAVSSLACILAVPPASGDNDDPANDTPTDNRITVTITDVTFTVTDKGSNSYTSRQVITGTSTTTEENGTIHHIGSTLVTSYYKDGSILGGEVESYSPDGYNFSFENYAHTVTEKKENWTEWEILLEQTLEITDASAWYDLIDMADTIKVFVRAYSDAGDTNWSQASKDFTSVYKSQWHTALGIEDGGDDDDDGPGFELIGVILGTLIVAVYRRKK